MNIDDSRWSHEGDFTQSLIDALERVPGVAAVRVEDAPSSRADTGYALLSNELYVSFAEREVVEPRRLLGVVPWNTSRTEPALTLAGLGAALEALDGIGPPDYSDDSMIQYLRTQRIVAPYQTRGVKVVELIRIYAAALREERPGTEAR
jgi:hypothetical protein